MSLKQPSFPSQLQLVFDFASLVSCFVCELIDFGGDFKNLSFCIVF